MKDPTKTELEASASALLDAIVRAEIELRAIETSCRSLEDAIELGQEALASAPATQAEGETEWEAARVAAPVAASTFRLLAG